VGNTVSLLVATTDIVIVELCVVDVTVVSNEVKDRSVSVIEVMTLLYVVVDDTTAVIVSAGRVEVIVEVPV